jgi:hypothetical protein
MLGRVGHRGVEKALGIHGIVTQLWRFCGGYHGMG